MFGGIARDVGGAGANFAPVQFAIAVAIEFEHVVEVAQGDVPTHLDVFAVGRGAQGEVAVARLVGQGRCMKDRRKDDHHDVDDEAAHRDAPPATSWSAMAANAGSSYLLVRNQSSAGCADLALFAANAARIRISASRGSFCVR